MFAAAAFAVVLVSHDNGPNTLGLVCPRDLSHRQVGFTGQDVGSLTWLRREAVVGAEEHIVADFVQVTAELEPRPSRRNMIGRSLTFGLDQERQFLEVLAIPFGERLQQLQSLAGRRNVDGQI